jgi:hypothetical protein
VKDGGESVERGLEEAVSRALRDNLNPLQRTADELHQACADFVAACGSSKPGNALPALLRAQTAASSLASALSVLSNFVVASMKPPERHVSFATGAAADAPDADPQAEAPQSGAEREALDVESRGDLSYEELPLELEAQIRQGGADSIEPPVMHETLAELSFDTAAAAGNVAASEPAFDVSSFPPDIQELHRRANRVAKVAMQDIKLLRPQEVQAGRQNKDICERLRGELDKARKEYDRRFRAIQDHPVDYFHRWMVEILAEGHAEALGEYPYPSPVLRH